MKFNIKYWLWLSFKFGKPKCIIIYLLHIVYLSIWICIIQEIYYIFIIRYHLCIFRWLYTKCLYNKAKHYLDTWSFKINICELMLYYMLLCLVKKVLLCTYVSTGIYISINSVLLVLWSNSLNFVPYTPY